MGGLSPCLDCGCDEISVTDASPGHRPAYVRCLGCGTAVMGDSVERAVWIWNLPRQAAFTGPQ